MVREKLKWRPHESESTDAGNRGGPTCSSDEVSVMEMERRGWIVQLYLIDQPGNGRNLLDKARQAGFRPSAGR